MVCQCYREPGSIAVVCDEPAFTNLPTVTQPFDAHCCHMDTAIKLSVPDRVKPSFVILDIRALWRSALSIRVPGCPKLQMIAWHGLAQKKFIAVPIWASNGWDILTQGSHTFTGKNPGLTPLTILGQETRRSYSTTPLSPHRAGQRH